MRRVVISYSQGNFETFYDVIHDSLAVFLTMLVQVRELVVIWVFRVIVILWRWFVVV
jgi:hypothetical protein